MLQQYTQGQSKGGASGAVTPGRRVQRGGINEYFTWTTPIRGAQQILTY